MAPRRRSASSSKSKKPERVGLGGGSVDEHLARPKRRRSERWARIGDGNTIQARVVDAKEYFVDGDVHEVEFERKDGSTYTMDRRCLDTKGDGDPCPGCRDDLDSRYKFWMLVIVRDAEKVNKAGKVIGEEDQLRILSGANRLVKELNKKQKRKDLSKRDIEITQRGEGFEVEYEVEWVDDEDTPMSKADKRLIEDDPDDIKGAFALYTELVDEDDFYEPPKRDDEEEEDVGAKSKRRGSAFGERKKKGTLKKSSRDEDEDDDDDEDEDERPARRRRSTAKRSTAPKKGILAAKKKSSGNKPAIKSKTRRRK